MIITKNKLVCHANMIITSIDCTSVKMPTISGPLEILKFLKLLCFRTLHIVRILKNSGEHNVPEPGSLSRFQRVGDNFFLVT
jgi:hypothetical protein